MLYYFVSLFDDSRSGITIKSDTLVLSVATLILMLLATVGSIHFSGWRLNPRLGITCVILYFVFVAESLLLEYDVINL